jgi:VanZ family protein
VFRYAPVANPQDATLLEVNKIIHFIKYWSPICLYMLLIVILSSLSKPPVPQPGLPHIDKLYHLIEYGILSFFFIRAFTNSSSKILSNDAIFFTVLVTVIFGFTDEIHQAFVPGRSSDIIDWVFDGIGAVAGVFAFRLWVKIHAKISRRSKKEDWYDLRG